MSVEMQKESEADSGLYSDINRSLGRRKKCNGFYILSIKPRQKQRAQMFSTSQ